MALPWLLIRFGVVPPAATAGFINPLTFWRGGVISEVAVQPTPHTQEVPAGGIYQPPPRRRGYRRRIVFLERELIEQHERARELDELIRATEGRARETEAETIERGDLAAIRALERNAKTLEAIRVSIAALEMELAQLQKLQRIEQDEDDALAVILMAATLH